MARKWLLWTTLLLKLNLSKPCYHMALPLVDGIIHSHWLSSLSYQNCFPDADSFPSNFPKLLYLFHYFEMPPCFEYSNWITQTLWQNSYSPCGFSFVQDIKGESLWVGQQSHSSRKYVWSTLEDSLQLASAIWLDGHRSMAWTNEAQIFRHHNQEGQPNNCSGAIGNRRSKFCQITHSEYPWTYGTSPSKWGMGHPFHLWRGLQPHLAIWKDTWNIQQEDNRLLVVWSYKTLDIRVASVGNDSFLLQNPITITCCPIVGKFWLGLKSGLGYN